MIRRRPRLQEVRRRRAIAESVLDGEVSWCNLKTGQRKVIYPTEELAAKAARRLNKLPTVYAQGEPYLCDQGEHWHLRSARPGN